jgi:predicted metal-dependent enzyme (double-stranded beta helix superfamily)
MDALIGLYSGGETNFLYAVADGRLKVPQRHDAIAPCVVQLDPQTVHSVANTGNARSGALHVYLGDLPRTHRQLWRLPDGRAEPFDNDRYLAGAVPIAQSGGDLGSR